MSLVGSWVIKSQADLAEAETAIVRCLRGESGRCGFLRSEAYARLRLAALYSVRSGVDETLEACHDRLRVTLQPSGVLSVSWVDPSEAPDTDFIAAFGLEPGPVGLGKRKV